MGLAGFNLRRRQAAKKALAQVVAEKEAATPAPAPDAAAAASSPEKRKPGR
jgi:hypothetical protein